MMNENNVNLNTQESQNIIFKNGMIHVVGFCGPGKIEIYTIIGNQIMSRKVKEFNSFRLPLKVESSNIYIVRILNKNRYKSFKFTVP
jgi:hypothetical protein